MTKKIKGFTLIEILVVVFIIGIIVALAVVVPRHYDQHRVVKDEALRLTTLFHAASERALLAGGVIGFILSKNQYQWVEWNRESESWDRLSQRQWSPRIFKTTVQIDIESELTDDDKIDQPQALFYSDGSITPTRLTLKDINDRSYIIVLETDGINPLHENSS